MFFMKDYIWQIGIKKLAKVLASFLIAKISASPLSEVFNISPSGLEAFILSLLTWLLNYLKIRSPFFSKVL